MSEQVKLILTNYSNEDMANFLVLNIGKNQLVTDVINYFDLKNNGSFLRHVLGEYNYIINSNTLSIATDSWKKNLETLLLILGL